MHSEVLHVQEDQVVLEVHRLLAHQGHHRGLHIQQDREDQGVPVKWNQSGGYSVKLEVCSHSYALIAVVHDLIKSDALNSNCLSRPCPCFR